MLATVTDSESGIKATYYYDLIDRLCKYEEAGQDYSFIMEYGFNERNQVSYAFETINGNKRSIGITYDKDGRVTSYRKGGVTEAYTYDKFGRLTNKATTVEIDEEVETRLTETLTYRTNSSGNATGQVNTMSINAPSGYHIYFTYGYDMNGNIAFVKSGDMTTNYTYDSAGQLIREDNQAQGKSWTWVYDNAGNILSKKEYAYTTGALGTATDTVSYVYDTGSWGDLLTSFDGQAITYDNIGNPLTIGNRSFTWKHGRELATLTENGVTWTNTYNADGLRISRTNGTLTYQYYYADGQLVRIGVGSKYLDISYDASGVPMALYYSGYQVDNAHYYYVTNLQGDVVAILNDAGTAVVTYTYDAWGNILSVGGSMAATLGVYNPLRYRGYVYDEETSLYYLQSRYYDPNMGRFLNADNYSTTGQGFTGNNMFVYCGNNSAYREDEYGEFWTTTDYSVRYVYTEVAETYENGSALYRTCIYYDATKRTFFGLFKTGESFFGATGFSYVVTKDGAVIFDNNQSSAYLLEDYDIQMTLSHEMTNAARSREARALSGRTQKGIATELEMHYKANDMGILPSKAGEAYIGSMYGGKGRDKNAWFFELMMF